MGNYFSEIFGASPVAPIQKHMEKVYDCVEELEKFFGSVCQGDFAAASDSRERIVQLENEADELKREIRGGLPKSLFMPVPREDLLELVLVQDSLANTARDVSGLVLGRKLPVPAELSADFLAYVKRNVDAARKARKSVRELGDLYETGFRGAEVELVESLINELDAIEDDTDEMQASLRTNLQAIEGDMPPIDAMFLYRVIEVVGEVGDEAERVGRRLELLLAG